ncbi:TRAP transporter small permease [Thermodesulfobacteriota bacterium]
MQLVRLRAIRRVLHVVIRVTTWMAAAALGIMISIIVINVIGRYLFGRPFMGTVEIVQELLVITVFFSVAHTEVRKSHISFDEVVARFPRRARSILTSVVCFVAAVYFFLMSWQEVVLAGKYMRPVISGTDVLHIPIFPFVFIIAIGAILLGLEMLLNGFFLISSEDGKKDEVR